MIKLTVNPDLQPDVKIFDQSTVIIGSDVPTTSDISLPGESLSPMHVKIQEQDNCFIIINHANDPFVTLNGFPFGKKTLKENDIIQIGRTTIRFNGESSRPSQDPQESKPASSANMQMMGTDGKLNDILEQIINNQRVEKRNYSSKESYDLRMYSGNKKEDDTVHNLLNQNIDLAPDIDDLEGQANDLLADEEWNIETMDEKDLQELLKQVEDLEDHPKEAKDEIPFPSGNREDEDASTLPKTDQLDDSLQPQPSFHSLMNQTTLTKNKGSLKDSYMSEFEDENQRWNQNKKFTKNEENLPEKWNWKLIGIIAVILFILSFILGTFFYTTMIASNSEEEIKAAESIADVAMALTFAQVNHIKPQNQNWSDPEFLKNNLLAVLSTDSIPLAQLDNHGQFSNLSYLLRIYTNNDLSQFLIIAQPAPSLLQWLIPKASILVYSKSMELRKTSDLKSINRLLLNPTTLDGMSAIELSHVVKQGEIIPLETLAAKENPGDFKLPPALAHIRPGAENLIYNAPRYYHFGEGFLKKAQMLAHNLENSYEFAFFQEEMFELANYPNIVLYTSHGIQWARQSQKQINVFLPNNKILIAYLKLNPKGIITNSQLLMDEGPSDVAIALDPSLTITETNMDMKNDIQQENLPTTNDMEESLIESRNGIDTLHPLYSQLRTLSTDYKNALQPIDNEIKALLESSHLDDNIALLDRLQKFLIKSEKSYQDNPEKLEKNQAALAFIERLQNILTDYREISQRENEKLTQELSKLYQDHPNIPVSEFISYLKATGFASHVQDHLKLHEKLLADNVLIESQITELLKKIPQASNLDELSQSVKDLSDLLNLEKVADTQKLIFYQNSVRVQVLEKLNEFLLSSDKALADHEFVNENRTLIANILKDAWVVDPDEFDFYLNEFDMRVQNADTVSES